MIKFRSALFLLGFYLLCSVNSSALFACVNVEDFAEDPSGHKIVPPGRVQVCAGTWGLDAGLVFQSSSTSITGTLGPGGELLSIIRGPHENGEGDGSNPGIDVDGIQKILVKDLRVESFDPTLKISGASDITVQNCHIQGSTNRVATVANSNKVIIKNNTFLYGLSTPVFSTQHEGVLAYGNNRLNIEGNYFQPLYPPNYYSRPIIATPDIGAFVLKSNTFRGGGSLFISTSTTQMPPYTGSILVDGNSFYGNELYFFGDGKLSQIRVSNNFTDGRVPNGGIWFIDFDIWGNQPVMKTLNVEHNVILMENTSQTIGIDVGAQAPAPTPYGNSYVEQVSVLKNYVSGGYRSLMVSPANKNTLVRENFTKKSNGVGISLAIVENDLTNNDAVMNVERNLIGMQFSQPIGFSLNRFPAAPGNPVPAVGLSFTQNVLTAQFTGGYEIDKYQKPAVFNGNFWNTAQPSPYLIKAAQPDPLLDPPVDNNPLQQIPPEFVWGPFAAPIVEINGKQISYDGSDSGVMSLSQAVFSWNFGDGTVPALTTQGTHLYEVPGIYTVTLTVEEAGNVSAISQKVRIL